MVEAYRDENFVPTLIASSNVDGKTPVRLYADPVTHRLLVDMSGGGNVSNTGTPLNNQIAVWTNATTIEGDTALTFDTTTDILTVGGIVKTPRLQADTSAGIILEASNGTDVGDFGVGNTANVAWYGSHNFSTATQDTIAAFTGTGKTLGSLATATYPSLTELSYVKGVTSSIQTQLNAKQATITFGTGVQTALGVNIGSAGAPVLFNGALGTPSSGTITNLTGTASININGTVGATTPAAGTFTTVTTTGNIELGNASDTTLSRSSAGVLAVEGVAVPTISSTDTLTNKRITKRVQAVTSAGTVTASLDNDDVVTITAQAAALTLANPTGTGTQGQSLVFRIKDNGTARAITYGANFRAIGVTLPTTSVINKAVYLGGFWNSTDTKLDIVAVAQEA